MQKEASRIDTITVRHKLELPYTKIAFEAQSKRKALGEGASDNKI